MERSNTDLDNLTQDELEFQLKRTLEELNDVNEMQQAVLGQTGIHIGVVLLQKYHSRFDRDKERLEKRISDIRSRLDSFKLDSEATKYE